MKFKNLLLLTCVLAAIGLSTATNAVAQEKMKYEDYVIELQKWKDREATAQTEISKLEGEIAELRTKLSNLDSQIADLERQTFRAMNSSEQGLQQYSNQLDNVEDQLNGLLNLSPGNLVDREDEIERLRQRIADLEGRGEALHPDSQKKLDQLKSLLSRLEAALARAKESLVQFDIYNVQRGDYLWKISKKSDIYNDPFQWMKIYTKNRDLISNPDLIFPDQNLKIFRKLPNNEYEVMKGDFLSKIAGRADVFGDPFKWTKIYEANKGVIQDPNVIYPHMVLIFPDNQ